jgi:hypothetical protein
MKETSNKINLKKLWKTMDDSGAAVAHIVMDTKKQGKRGRAIILVSGAEEVEQIMRAVKHLEGAQ